MFSCRYQKLHLPAKGYLSGVPNIHGNKKASSLTDMITISRPQVHSKQSKNVKILHLAAVIWRKIKGSILKKRVTVKLADYIIFMIKRCKKVKHLLFRVAFQFIKRRE